MSNMDDDDVLKKVKTKGLQQQQAQCSKTRHTKVIPDQRKLRHIVPRAVC